MHLGSDDYIGLVGKTIAIELRTGERAGTTSDRDCARQAGSGCGLRDAWTVTYEEGAPSAGKHGIGCFAARGIGPQRQSVAVYATKDFGISAFRSVSRPFVPKFFVSTTAFELGEHEFVISFWGKGNQLCFYVG